MIKYIFNNSALISAIFVLGVYLISVVTPGYIYGVASTLLCVLAVNFAFDFPFFAFNFTIAEKYCICCNFADCNYDDLIDSVLIKFHKRYPQQAVDVDIPEEFVSIPMDALLIEQVMINILENAVQHAEGMTSLRIEVFEISDKAVFEISDNGCGIPDAKLKDIFSGIYTTNLNVPDGKNNAGIIYSRVGADWYGFSDVWQNKQEKRHRYNSSRIFNTDVRYCSSTFNVQGIIRFFLS